MRGSSDVSSGTRLVEGVAAVPKDKLVQNIILNSVLKTHENLSVEDRSFVVPYIVSLNLSKQELSKFILQTYQLSNTGRFSLTYNLDLNKSIKTRDKNRVSTLIRIADTEQAWPELYNNPYLCQSEIETIKNMSNREYYAILNAIQMTNCSPNLDNIIPCQSVDSDTLTVGDNIYYNSLYSKCYDNICIYEGEQKGKVVSLSNSDVPKVAYVATNNNGKIDKQCFPIMELIGQLAIGNYVNPKTNTPFSERTLSQILDKYHKEIAMYRRYLEIYNKV